MNENATLSKEDVFAILTAISCRLADLSQKNNQTSIVREQFQKLAKANDHFRQLFPFYLPQ